MLRAVFRVWSCRFNAQIIELVIVTNVSGIPTELELFDFDWLSKHSRSLDRLELLQHLQIIVLKNLLPSLNRKRYHLVDLIVEQMTEVTGNLIIANQALDVSLCHIDSVSQNKDCLAYFLPEYLDPLSKHFDLTFLLLDDLLMLLFLKAFLWVRLSHNEPPLILFLIF